MRPNNKKMCAALIAAPMLLNSNSAIAADNDIDQRINELERQLEELKGEVSDTRSQSEANQAQVSEVSAETESLQEARSVKKGTKFNFGGYVKLDAMYSSYSEGKPSGSSPLIEDFLVGSLIPVESSSGTSDSYQSLNMHAKESRINFATATVTDVGTITGFLEMDFLIIRAEGDERVSNSWGGRLHHAFVKWQYNENSYFMAGQFWSAFFNTAALPDQLDFVGTIGTVFERQPLIQWGWSGFKVSLENPYTRLNDAKTTTTETIVEGDDGELVIETQSSVEAVDVQSDSETIPDLVLRYDGKAGNFGWMVAGLGRQLSYDKRDSSNAQTADDNEFGYGLNFSGVVNIGRDDLRFSATYGNALGRYFGVNAFNDGYIDEDGNIEHITQYGGYIAYRHFWSGRWRSSINASFAEADNPDDAFGDADLNSLVGSWAKSYRSAHVNLIYTPYPTLSLGGEFIYGSKELEDGRSGSLSRFQFSTKYVF